ncbi:MAG: SDR family oxidoreductase [Acidobacteriia bacterium]|nr:SDR family oxidoreductase [Terriglobia bacterium]
MKFKNKVVFITGASSGIGRALAIEFAREGAHVAAVARDAPRLTALSGQLRDLGVEALALPCDITQREALKAAVDTTASHFRRLDVLVNNAGRGLYAPLATVPTEDFEQVMNLNFWAPVWAVQSAMPHFERQGRGVIVNISSILGKVDFPWMGAYCATKHALNSISNALRMELKEKHVDVLTVCPGRVRTEFQPNAIKYKAVQNSSWSAGALSPDDVARAVVRGVWTHKREIVIPRAGWLLAAVQHLAPRLADRLAVAFSSK